MGGVPSLENVFERLPTIGGVAVLPIVLLVTLHVLLLTSVVLELKVFAGAGLVTLPDAIPAFRPESLMGDLVTLRPIAALLERDIILPFLASTCFLGSPFSALDTLGVREPVSVRLGAEDCTSR